MDEAKCKCICHTGVTARVLCTSCQRTHSNTSPTPTLEEEKFSLKLEIADILEENSEQCYSTADPVVVQLFDLFFKHHAQAQQRIEELEEEKRELVDALKYSETALWLLAAGGSADAVEKHKKIRSLLQKHTS